MQVIATWQTVEVSQWDAGEIFCSSRCMKNILTLIEGKSTIDLYLNCSNSKIWLEYIKYCNMRFDAYIISLLAIVKDYGR